MNSIVLPTFEDVLSAATRIAPHAQVTPLLRSRTLDELSGAQLFFKCENLQRAGAFKFRGACNAVWSLSDAEAARGVVTHSSGNHGAALALAARTRGIAAHVVVPRGAIPAKLAALAKWKYDVVSYDPANPSTLNAAIDTAITKKANYIAEAGIPLTPAMIKKVQDAGAKWVLTSVHPVEVKDPIIVDANAYENDEQMGKVLADFFVSDSKGKGNVVIEHVPAYPILDGFTDGFQAEVKALCPDCKVKIQEITIPDLTAGKVPSVMVSALRSNPDADYVAFDVGPFAAGIDAALASAGLSNKVKVIGQAADEAGIAALKTGKQTAWTGFDPVYSTYVMMDAMFRDSLGMPIDAEASGLQTTQILTKDNVGDISTWSEPKDALNQFKALWGLS